MRPPFTPDPSVFQAYDLRGVHPDTVDEAFAQALGLAVGIQARQEGEATVAVGRDGRESSPSLAAALVDGLLQAGVDVLDLGPCTTPMAWFAASTRTRSAVQVTASHNPRHHNGFKLQLAGRTLHGAALQRLREAMGRPGPLPAVARGRAAAVDVFPDYLARITAGVRLARPLKVVLDCGNGIAGATSPAVLRALGCEVVGLHTEVDGRFPNHHPDPSRPGNLRDLVAAVQLHRADLGLALDGDGDRLGVVSASGAIVWPDRWLVLLARDVLARQPGAPIVFDVKSSQRLPAAIAAAGGRPVMAPSGYVLLKERLHALQAPLGGELSGHVVFADRWPGFDDGTYVAARLLEVLARDGDPGALLDGLPDSVSTPELHVPCADAAQARAVAAALAARAAEAAGSDGAQACTLDGLRLDWPDGFGLVRASNTTPVLTLRFEGHDAAALGRIRARMLALLHTVLPGARVD